VVDGWSTSTVLAVDYDLVIIGNTYAARVAAQQAAGRSRVALVMPPTPLDTGSHFYPHALYQASLHGVNRNDHYPWQYAATAINHLTSHIALPMLAAKGVDIVEETGAFQRLPKLAFNTARRSLRGRKYLLAMGGQPTTEYPIAGLAATGYLTAASLSQVLKRLDVPRSWAIIGDEAIGVEMAQALRCLGYDITLIVTADRILPREDPDAVAAIQFQLEASGVKLITNGIISEAGNQDGHKYVIVNRRIIHIEEIFVAVPEQPWVDSFDLLAARVDYDELGVRVDHQMETSNPAVYACGSVCGSAPGGYYGEHLAEYEAQLAVNNALSRRTRSAKLDHIPWTIFSYPQIARVGITEVVARERFQQRLLILRSNYHDNAKALLTENDHGFLKLLVRPNGYVVGATVVGADAAELVQILALAVWQKIRIEVLADFPGITITHSRLLVEAARQWRQPSLWVRSIDPLLQIWSDIKRTVRSSWATRSARKKSPRHLKAPTSHKELDQSKLNAPVDLLSQAQAERSTQPVENKSLKPPR
jgi:pyruvate/2-oxoglutarate dehydrogenase complex dihydrolipoamide dehydrogenase (E3) component